MANIVDVMTFLIPEGGWIVIGNDFDGVQFIEATPITKTQFEQGVISFEAWKIEQDLQTKKAKETAQAKLAALGLTANDLKALGL